MSIKKSSVFSKIVTGAIPSYKIAESENCYAFLDISPIKKGHTLVIPKKEIDYIFDLSDEELTELHLFSKRVAQAIKMAIPCKRIGTAVIGLEVPHAHIHLVPINNIDDISFSNPRPSFNHDEMNEIAEKIKLFFK